MSYEPTNWKKGDKVTSTRLNKIELGIKGLDDNVEEIKEDIASSGTGLSEDAINALLQIARKVVYIDNGGQEYYNALINAFNKKTSRYLTIDDVIDSTGYNGLSITEGTAACTSVTTFGVFIIDPKVMPIKLNKSVSNDSIAYTIFKDNENGSYYGVDSSGRTFLFEKTQDNTKLNATQVDSINTISKTGDTTGSFVANINNGVLTCTYTNGGIISFTNANVFGIWGSSGIKNMPVDCEVNYNDTL